MKVTRRQILAAMAAIPLVSGLSAGAVGLRWYNRAPGATLLVLADDEYAFIQALAETWMPAGGTPSLSGAEADLGRFADDLISSMASMQQTLIKLLLQVLDDATLPTHFASFKSLEIAEREIVLRGWLNADQPEVRTAVSTMLLLLGEGWGTHPKVVEHMRNEYPCGYGR